VTRYRAGADALAATLAEGAVLLNLRTNRYHSLNASGTRIWELLIEGRTEDEIVQTLAGEYDVNDGIARDETRTLIAALDAAGLIVQDAS
jgi:hypothetical protein